MPQCQWQAVCSAEFSISEWPWGNFFDIDTNVCMNWGEYDSGQTGPQTAGLLVYSVQTQSRSSLVLKHFVDNIIWNNAVRSAQHLLFPGNNNLETYCKLNTEHCKLTWSTWQPKDNPKQIQRSSHCSWTSLSTLNTCSDSTSGQPLDKQEH